MPRWLWSLEFGLGLVHLDSEGEGETRIIVCYLDVNVIKKNLEMTIGEKGQHQNISREQSFMNSNEQNGKVDGSAQKRLLISDVKWDLQKKQWQFAGPQEHAAIQENHDLQRKQRRRSQYKCRQKKKAAEDGTHDEQRLLEKGHSRKRKKAVGGLNHLLILADSAELLLESGDNCHSAKRDNQYQGHKINPNAHHLQNGHSSANSSGQRRTENPLDASRGNHNVEAEKTAFRLQGKIRLTHLRRQARSKSHELVQETQESQALVHVDPKSFVDAQDVEKVAADQVQEGMGRQNVEAVLAKCYSQLVDGTQEDQIHELDQQHASRQTEAKVCEEQRGRQYHANHAAQRPCQQIDFRRGQVCIAEPLQDGREQPTMPHHVITHYPVQITNGPLLWPDKSRDPSMKQHLSVSQQEQVNPLVKDQIGELSVTETQLPLHVSETKKDHRLIARERRKLRTHRRKKLPKEQPVHTAQLNYLMPDAQVKQMYEAGQQWHWHMWNFHNWRMWEAEQQGALQNMGRPLNGHQLSEDKHVVGGSQHPHVVTRADQDKPQLEVNNDSRKYTIIDFQRDQSVEHQNHETVKAYSEPDKTTSSVKGRTRERKCHLGLLAGWMLSIIV
ncbi:hypothetical protein BVC80_1453g4 [Macleaya cordata]|uniref:Uncharacterized protein n=1 Tax=Macleaya cordata TaxID=56857 RepID=A0A200PPH2_MACCD|nr:hypothetical protein BVC80_1453g4 [Macleaya cordata]